MLDQDGLNLWCGQHLVGFLWRNAQGQIGFGYAQEWLESPGRFALSRTVPLQTAEFLPEQAVAHRFFANLLPEGGAREQVVRDLKITNTDFDLLRAIGGECAGAFTILRAEQEPQVKYDYYRLEPAELEQLVKRRGQPYSWAAHERPRLSLAGAQDKCPVLLRDGDYWLPKQESPSSHILKFELADYRNLPAYETFTSMLARSVGLEAVNISLQQVGKTRFALIQRYDRVMEGECGIARLHQEDFCQALGVGHQKKYQEDGGPDFADCYRLLQLVSTEPAHDLLQLLDWQIFNVLAGNSDGHAKNLSLLYLPGGDVRLAPFYDLICTRAIERIDFNLALSVGGQRNPGQLVTKNWADLAIECGLQPRFVLARVKQMATALPKQLARVRERFETLYGAYPALQRVEQVVQKQCHLAAASLELPFP
ncbi:MAG: type II toxin-antitoxin system HipA family toxin [Gammaproteobacteria bacterium]|nr:type II toxin-antitoxin system HipA family toxin [Gammaproteobacteria bacterium]